MQYLPGLTVQCINPLCEMRGHWMRADVTGPVASDGRCPCCGDFLRNVPPPLGRLRIRPRSLTARPLRPRDLADLSFTLEIFGNFCTAPGLYLYSHVQPQSLVGCMA